MKASAVRAVAAHSTESSMTSRLHSLCMAVWALDRAWALQTKARYNMSAESRRT